MARYSQMLNGGEEFSKSSRSQCKSNLQMSSTRDMLNEPSMRINEAYSVLDLTTTNDSQITDPFRSYFDSGSKLSCSPINTERKKRIEKS